MTPDREDTILAIPEASILDTAEDGAEAGDGWGSIRLATLPPAEPFPLDVLPIPVRDFAEAVARSIGCPVDFPAVATLAAASAAIGRSACLEVKPGYRESASLYAALVGSPSSGKSPSLRAALAPVGEIALELHRAWRAEMDRWEDGPAKDRGPSPVLQRITTTDPTTEALGPILARNPRGLAVTPDEMTKWVMSMDQYKGGKGGDRPFYLSAWGGETITIDRAKFMDEPIMVPAPFLTVAGGMTSGMLTALSEACGREDGFTARLLFTFPEAVARPYSDEGIPPEASDGWREVVRSLWDRPMVDSGGTMTPRVVRMTAEARQAWAAWCQAHRDEQEADDFSESLEGPWGKLEAYAARFVLILHLIDLASDPTRPAPLDPPEVPWRIIAAAARLIGYFKAHAVRVRAEAGGMGEAGGEDVKALLGWVGRNGVESFSRRDIARNFNRFKDDASALDDALGWLICRNLIRPRPEPTSKAGGRKPSPAYEVNPDFHRSPRFRRHHRDRSGSVGNVGNAVVRGKITSAIETPSEGEGTATLEELASHRWAGADESPGIIIGPEPTEPKGRR